MYPFFPASQATIQLFHSKLSDVDDIQVEAKLVGSVYHNSGGKLSLPACIECIHWNVFLSI